MSTTACFERQQSPRRPAAERMLALIDVVFLLLIFFMLSGTLRPPQPLEVAAPESASAEPSAPRAESPVVWLDRAGAVALDAEPLARSELASRLRARLAATSAPDATGRVELRADARVPASALLPLLEELEAAGAREIDLVTQRRPAR